MRFPSPCSSIIRNPTILRAPGFGTAPPLLHRMKRLLNHVGIRPLPLQPAGDGGEPAGPVAVVVVSLAEDAEGVGESIIGDGRGVVVGVDDGGRAGTVDSGPGEVERISGDKIGSSGENREVEVQH